MAPHRLVQFSSCSSRPELVADRVSAWPWQYTLVLTMPSVQWRTLRSCIMGVQPRYLLQTLSCQFGPKISLTNVPNVLFVNRCHKEFRQNPGWPVSKVMSSRIPSLQYIFLLNWFGQVFLEWEDSSFPWWKLKKINNNESLKCKIALQCESTHKWDDQRLCSSDAKHGSVYLLRPVRQLKDRNV